VLEVDHIRHGSRLLDVDDVAGGLLAVRVSLGDVEDGSERREKRLGTVLMLTVVGGQ
jgi:hypothetical protein